MPCRKAHLGYVCCIALHAPEHKVAQLAYNKLQRAHVSNLICVLVVAHCNNA